MGERRTEAEIGGSLIFTILTWAIGLAIMAVMGYLNFLIVVDAFEKHWALGALSVIVSLICWLVLLGFIFSSWVPFL
jgi:ABC-type transport system involved in multi-copper enzyme maturation permease subunit